MKTSALVLAVFAAWFGGCQTPPARESAPAPHGGEFTANLNGLRLWYKVSGAGPVALFPTPGYGPSADMYISSLKPLEKCFTVVYLDTRGSGRSERPPTLQEYRYADFIADLDALREHLKQERVWLIGHSMGGVLAMQYAIAHPQHCRGLFVLNSAPAIEDDEHERDFQRRMDEHRNKPWFKKAMEALQKDADDAIKDDEEFKALMMQGAPFHFYDTENIEKNKHHFVETCSLAANRGFKASNPKKLERLQLERIKAPTLVVVGSHDIFCSPRQAERIHLGIAGSKLMVIERAGHFPWLEQPERFFMAVRRGLSALGIRAVASD